MEVIPLEDFSHLKDRWPLLHLSFDFPCAVGHAATLNSLGWRKQDIENE